MKPMMVKEKSTTALLIIDMLNPFDFPEGEKLAKRALVAAENIAKLKRKFKKKGHAVVYLNDNFGKWRSNFQDVCQMCLEQEGPTAEIARLLMPDESDYFILKPRHSGFYGTCLETLLHDMGAKTLVLTGVSTSVCVLFTAADAHMRDFKLWVPRDATAALDAREEKSALELMRKTFAVKISDSRHGRV